MLRWILFPGRSLGYHLNPSPYTNKGNCVFFNVQYGADPCLGYEVILFWDKRGTFLMLWSVMQNMGISHNLQNERKMKQWVLNNSLIKVEFKMNIIWKPYDLDFNLKELNNGSIHFGQRIGVCFWEVLGKIGLSSAYIWSVFRVQFWSQCTLMIL